MAIRIDLDIGRGTGVETTIERLIASLDRLQDRLDGIKASTSGGMGLGRAAHGVNSVGTAARQALGPMQRLIKAQQDLAAAMASGDQARVFDAQHNLTRAQNAVAKAKGVKNPGAPPPTPAEMLQQALMRTRFSASGAGFPLGVDIQRIMRSGGNASALFGTGAGGGAASGGLGAAMRAVTAVMRFAGPIGLATVAVTAFWKAAQSAADSLRSLGLGRARLGGTTGQVEAIERVGRLAGIPNGLEMAKQFGETIRSGTAAGYASGIGISPVGGPFGDTNSAAKFLRALEYLASDRTSDEQARRFAIGTGLEDALRIRDLSPALRQQALADMRSSMARGDNRGGIAAGAAFDFTTGRLANAWERLKRAMGPALILGMSQITMWVNLLSARIEFLTKIGEGFLKWITGLIDRLREWLGFDQKVANSREREIQALDANTRAMKEFRETLGGGARAQGALPGRIQGWQLNDEHIRREGLRLGVY